MLFLAAVILFGQIENEVLYSVDGIVYAVVGQELSDRTFWEWAYLTWGKGPFHEHPPLTPWLIALTFRLLGESTFAAVFVPAALSFATVALTMALGRRLIHESFGLAAGLVLSLTPQFIKAGRNPMLEPALQALIALSVFLFVRARQEKSRAFTLGSGLALGLAFLAKGPPALLALGLAAIVACLYSQRRFDLKVEAKNAALYLTAALLPIVLFDLWYEALGHGSFWKTYFSNQLHHTVVKGRDNPNFNGIMYLKMLLVEFQPWILLVLAAVPIQLLKKDSSRKRAWILGWAWVLGTIVPFTLMRHKAPWYIHIYYPGLALIAASLIHFGLGRARSLLWIPRAAMALAVPVVLLSSALPSSMQGHRPGERFLDRAKRSLGKSLEGATIADCMGISDWRGPFFYGFYFRANRAPCEDTQARYQVQQRGLYTPQPQHRILFAHEPWLLIDRGP